MKYTTIDDIDNSVLELALAFEKIPTIKSKRFFYGDDNKCIKHKDVMCNTCRRLMITQSAIQDDANELWKLRLKIAGKLLKTSPGTEAFDKLQAQDDILNQLHNILQNKIDKML